MDETLSSQLEIHIDEILKALQSYGASEELINFVKAVPGKVEDLEDECMSLVRFIEISGL